MTDGPNDNLETCVGCEAERVLVWTRLDWPETPRTGSEYTRACRSCIPIFRRQVLALRRAEPRYFSNTTFGDRLASHIRSRDVGREMARAR